MYAADSWLSRGSVLIVHYLCKTHLSRCKGRRGVLAGQEKIVMNVLKHSRRNRIRIINV